MQLVWRSIGQYSSNGLASRRQALMDVHWGSRTFEQVERLKDHSESPELSLNRRAFLKKYGLGAFLGLGFFGNFLFTWFQNQKTALRERASQLQIETLTRQTNDLKQQIGSLQKADLTRLAPIIGPSSVMVKAFHQGELYSFGSGVWIQDKTGQYYVITNGHVVDPPQYNKDHKRTAHTPDYKNLKFTIQLYTGSDAVTVHPTVMAEMALCPQGTPMFSPFGERDLAILKPKGLTTDLKKRLQAATWRELQVAPIKALEQVISVGSPKGWQDSFAVGRVSNADRLHEDEPNNWFIQHDTPINGGNSGGPLFDDQGRLIGINSRKPPNAEEGLAFSIRIDQVLSVLRGWGLNPILSPREIRGL